MKFLSTWLRNDALKDGVISPTSLLNEVPEHMAQEFEQGQFQIAFIDSSMKFLSTWLRNFGAGGGFQRGGGSSMKFLSTWLRNTASWQFDRYVDAPQ